MSVDRNRCTVSLTIFKIGILTLLLVCCQSFEEKYYEQLLIRPLPSGNVYTVFHFNIDKDIVGDNEEAFHHYRVFPLSMGESLLKHQVQELHFSLTQGLWRYEKWGYPRRGAPPGAEIWAYFKGKAAEVTSNWKNLVNILSGQFCTSLNFIDETNSAIPRFSFRPQGSIPSDAVFNESFIRYSNLPSEIVCTENLTPFRKLLPCSSRFGLTTLLNALNLFNAPYVSIAVDVQTICKDVSCSKAQVHLVNTVSVVFDPLRMPGGKKDWSFAKLFGSFLVNKCPLASTSHVFVDPSAVEDDFTLNPPPTGHVLKEGRKISVYDVNAIIDKSSLNIAAEYNKPHVYGIIPPPPFHAERKITGYGQQNGGILCSFYNNQKKDSLKIVYFDLIPWYLRLYSHTLTIKSNNKDLIPDYYFYQPAKDRQQPHHLEIVLTLPPKSVTELSIDFDFAFLKWTEYPPDANHGFYVGSAVVSTLLDFNSNLTLIPSSTNYLQGNKSFNRIYTQILLVSLPTPDFSMPYNVICLTCTVVALAFGPIHSITTKNLRYQDEEDTEPFMTKLKRKVKEIWNSSDDQTDDLKKEKNEEKDKDL